MTKQKKEYGTEHAILGDISKHFVKNDLLSAGQFVEIIEKHIIEKHINHALKKGIVKVKTE